MRTKIIAATLTLVIGALAAAPAALGQDTWKEEIEVRPGQSIELRMEHGGSLEVEGWDRDVVRIVCDTGRNELDDYDFTVTETRDGLRFEADLTDRHIISTMLEVSLRVPNEFDIDTRSGGGGIRIVGVSGEFTGKSGGGGIELENVSGKVDLTTGGGWIEVVDCDLDGQVWSGGGGGVLRNVTGDLKGWSGGGALTYENVRDEDGDLRGPKNVDLDGATSGTIIKTSMGGGIKVDEAPEGAYVKTGGGDLDIRDASRFVRAWTGGGDVDIEVSDGWVKSFTGAGDVEVTVRGGFGDGSKGLDVFTGHGEVTITIPADASVEFDIDLSYTRNSGQDFEIESDFDLDLEHTRKWDKSRGSARKHIYGTATINGGDHKVEIVNVNGNVRIKRR